MTGKVMATDSNGHVLIVEDEKINQIVLMKVLDKLNFSYSLANNGQEGLTLYKKEKFDLVLMDILMPVMCGVSAIGEIREFERGSKKEIVPIIVITAKHNSELSKRVIKIGAERVIYKPIGKNELQDCIIDIFAN